MSDFILGGSKITANGDFSHEIKRYLFLGRKAMINLASVQVCDPGKESHCFSQPQFPHSQNESDGIYLAGSHDAIL